MGRAQNSKSNPWLDLVRALAIALVLMRHGERALRDAGLLSEGYFQNIFLNGWIGVDLFFVLSGYLITGSILRSSQHGQNFSPLRYFSMRALRILPAYYVALFLIVVGAFPFYEFDERMLSARVIYHMLFLQDYLPSDINVVFWSLGVEEKFYLLAPFLILLLMRFSKATVPIFLLSVLFLLPTLIRTLSSLTLEAPLDYPAFWRAYRSPFHLALEGLIVGVALAYSEHRRWIVRHTASGVAVLAVSLMTIVVVSNSHEFMSEITNFDIVVQPLLISVLVGLPVLGAIMLRETPMPMTAIVHAVAVLSYSLYLIHYPLIPWVIHETQSGGKALFWVVYLSASLVLSTGMYLLVELPFLKLKDKLSPEVVIGQDGLQQQYRRR